MRRRLDPTPGNPRPDPAPTGGSSLIPFGQVNPASRVRIPGRYGILEIVPDYPAKDRWVHAFKGTDGSTLDRVEMRCH